MGCFFGCFRFKEKERPSGLQAAVTTTKAREVISSSRSQSGRFSVSLQDAAGAPFLEEPRTTENLYRRNGSGKWNEQIIRPAEIPTSPELGSLSNGPSPELVPSSPPGGVAEFGDEDRNFDDEVKYLKSCGTLLRTPSEIKSAARTQKIASKDDKKGDSDWHSWFPPPNGEVQYNCQPGNSPTPPPHLYRKLSEVPTPNPTLNFSEQILERCVDENHNNENATNILQQNEHSGYKEDNEYGSVSTPQKSSSVGEDRQDLTNISPMSSKLVEPRLCRPFRYDQCPTIDEDNDCFSDAGSIASLDSATKNENLSFKQSDSPSRFEPKTPPLFKSNYSPKPTPLILTDDMQTPWTKPMENPGLNKNARIRAQYVYPVLNPVENLSQWKDLKKGNAKEYDQKTIPWADKSVVIENQSFGFQTPGSRGTSIDSVTKENLPSEEEMNVKHDGLDVNDETSQKKRHLAASPDVYKTPKLMEGFRQIPEETQSPATQLDSSLSHWLKTPPIEHGKESPASIVTPKSQVVPNARDSPLCKNIDDKPILGAMPVNHLPPVSPTKSTSSKSSGDYDRPILGLVAAHWNDKQSASPKWWDGKGIPNSTNKYKEDQKVSWHSTPFEERLEKALSSEGVGGRQLFVGKSTTTEEPEESDTAAS